MAVTSENIVYASSIDPALTNLKAILTYRAGTSNRPLHVWMHGFTGVSTSFLSTTRDRAPYPTYLGIMGVSGTFQTGETVSGGGVSATMFGYTSTDMALGSATGVFTAGTVITGATSGATATIVDVLQADVVCLFVDMRGRNGSSGSQDGGGREVYDIADAVAWVLANRASLVDATQIHFVGYSGGGANGLTMATRFPDLFNSIVAYFPISDYGFITNYGWWWTNGVSDKNTLQTWIGGTPLTARGAYHARMTQGAVSNYSQGSLKLYHDALDGTVPVWHTEQVRDYLALFDFDHVSVTITTASDTLRALHANPDLNAQPRLALFEPAYISEIHAKALPELTVPASGRLIVQGWVTTKRFELWLDDGLDRVGVVEYDGLTFNIRTTDQPSCPWTLRVFGQTPSASVVATVNGEELTETADGDGVAEFTGTYQRTRRHARHTVAGGEADIEA